MPTIYLDIETSRGPRDEEVEAELSSQLPPPEPPPPADQLQAPKNYKDADKISAWQTARHAELVAEHAAHQQRVDAAIREEWEGTPLRPLRGEVLCVGIAVDDGPPVVLWESSEKATLEKLQKGLLNKENPTFVAHNGLTFDFRFLALRAAHHGLYPLARMMFVDKPWGSRAHVDTRVAWQQADRRAEGKLPQIASFLGVPQVPNPITGADVPRLWHEVRVMAHDEPRRVEVVDQIRAHLIHDVVTLRGVHQLMQACGWCS